MGRWEVVDGGAASTREVVANEAGGASTTSKSAVVDTVAQPSAGKTTVGDETFGWVGVVAATVAAS